MNNRFPTLFQLLYELSICLRFLHKIFFLSDLFTIFQMIFVPIYPFSKHYALNKLSGLQTATRLFSCWYDKILSEVALVPHHVVQLIKAGISVAYEKQQTKRKWNETEHLSDLLAISTP